MDTTAVRNAALVSLLALPRPALRALAGGRRPAVDGQTLDAQLQFVLAMAARLHVPDASSVPLAQARANLVADAALFAPRPAPLERVEDQTIPGPAGPVPVRVYVPRARAARPPPPLILYFHGGGWTVGSVESHDAPCRALAAEAHAIVASVEYRLAPEHPFPAAPDDAYAAWRWALSNARALGADPTRIALAGDSAGGNLAAVTALRARDAGDPPPRGQILIYPATDLARGFPSHKTFARGYFLEERTIEFFIRSYLSDPATQIADWRASPLRAPELAGVAPAIVVTAGFDVLRDEGRAYADRLARAGVPVSYRCHTDLIHGFAGMAGRITRAREAVALLTSEVRELLGS